jgi:uncharacterized protein YbjT (DUF2867 family)
VPTEKILVAGATGKVGRELIPFLLEAGLEVRAGTLNPDRARALFGDEVEVLELNYDWAATYDATLIWSDRVFLVPPPFSPDAYEAMAPFVDWAVASRVKHIVLLSGMTVPDVDELALRKVELHLKEQDTAWSILRPNLYMQNFHPGFLSTEIRDESRIRLPAGDGKVSLVDVRDVAEVAARTLITAEHQGKEYTLTGEEALGLGDAAEVISRAAGRRIEYEPVSDEAFRKILEDRGWRPSDVEVVLGLFGSIRRGEREPVHPELPGLLGRPPRTLASFAEEHGGAWG